MEEQQTWDQEVIRKTYSVADVATILGISMRSAYHLCSHTDGFRVLHVGRTVRVHKESFEQWFSACS